MYVLFRNDMISSDEIAEKIQAETDFDVLTDLTKATKREDVLSFKLGIPVEKLKPNCKFDWEDEELVDELFTKAESLTKNFLPYFPKYTIETSGAYKWDEVTDSICLVVVIANIDIRMAKLKLDILTRMLKQVD